MAAATDFQLNKTEEIMEGFLCPVCLQDLTSIAQLQVHFEEKHSAEDKALLNSLKSIFSKARKLLNDSDTEDDAPCASKLPESKAGGAKIYSNIFSQNSVPPCLPNCNDPWNWQNTATVPQRSHTSLFKTIRSDRIDTYVAETNKLLLRLDKLLADAPSDPVKRKAQERELVPWVDDACVPLCPDCGRSFSALTRRRHHCRLCGAIMCNKCSIFMSMAFAKQLVAPVHVATLMSGSSAQGKSSPGHSRGNSGSRHVLDGSAGFSLRRSGSQGSLNSIASMMDQLTGEQHLRVCQHCHQRVCARDRAVQQRQHQPLLALLYRKLMTDRATLYRLLPQYRTMAASLWSGESVYNLSDACELRLKVLRLGDSINATAQKIKTLGPVEVQQSQLNDPENQPPLGPRQELLQKRIYQSAAAFLKTNVLGLDKLPDAEELQQLQTKRREQAARRLAEERKAAELAELRAEQALIKLRQRDAEVITTRNARDRSLNSSGSSAHERRALVHRPSPGASVGEEGWGGDADAHVVTATDDPVVQQMNIIRNYIKQAREACRYEEVSTLEKNLKELQVEYRRLNGTT
ncbi:rabenosyn-5 isoform X1 [Hyalella azteca]|uniref:Rabenosyn-5 isoform X1 n=1 Tax=Hyalella azteca TaxID=294128 RepID=A0A8B7NXM6_HYAAZ|nr:rabenosyn-5 isoform X1 [Hyalella azteca]